ncbi:hypothetical protein R1flu_020123 [Riccia fluitans]|uniref:Uncharacterized protein n=1 Tax=Riccia fluitans TaxID=41844 RepID=A0ABD1ZM33_9MARC
MRPRSSFEAFHVEFGNVTTEAMARNMKEIFAPPPIAEVDIQPWKEMVKNLIKLLTEEQKKNKEIVEQHDYYEGKIRHSKKVPEIANLRCGVPNNCRPREIRKCRYLQPWRC